MGLDRSTPAPTLVWDVDDVLNDLTRAWFETAWRPAHAQGPVTAYAQLTENPPHRLLGIARTEYLASLDAFRAGHYGRLAPNPRLLAWMDEHGHRFRHLALTAVPLAAAAYSGEWVFRHWGRWIRGIQVVPSLRDGQELLWDRSKVEYLRWLGHPDVTLIEDNPAACAEAAAAGFRALLVPQPWNADQAAAGVGRLAELMGE